MKQVVRRIGVALFLASGLLLVLVIVFPAERRTFVGAYELVLGAIALAALATSFGKLWPESWTKSPFDRVREPPKRSHRIDELDRIDRLVVLGGANAFDLHYRLRPLLRELAAERLAARHGVDLDGDPDRARPLLGDELWELVRPGREVGRRSGPGLPLHSLSRLVQVLETV
jgi:hypothetical protein